MESNLATFTLNTGLKKAFVTFSAALEFLIELGYLLLLLDRKPRVVTRSGR
jgi:hypothetical protein